MNVLGKPLSAYLSLTKELTVLVLIIGIGRLGLSLAGVSNSSTRWLSMSVVMWAGALYLAIRIHTSGFGGYKQLLPAVAIPNLATQLVSFAAITIGILTGVDNVFTAPEAAFGGDGKNWLHAISHPLVGGVVGSVAYWLVGCSSLFVLRKVFKKAESVAGV